MTTLRSFDHCMIWIRVQAKFCERVVEKLVRSHPINGFAWIAQETSKNPAAANALSMPNFSQ
jgi:hypothetical protein